MTTRSQTQVYRRFDFLLKRNWYRHYISTNSKKRKPMMASSISSSKRCPRCQRRADVVPCESCISACVSHTGAGLSITTSQPPYETQSWPCTQNSNVRTRRFSSNMPSKISLDEADLLTFISRLWSRSFDTRRSSAGFNTVAQTYLYSWKVEWARLVVVHFIIVAVHD